MLGIIGHLRIEYDGYDNGEMVRVVVSGNQEPRSIELTESILDLELEEIEERITAAMKEAHSRSVEVESLFSIHGLSSCLGNEASHAAAVF